MNKQANSEKATFDAARSAVATARSKRDSLLSDYEAMKVQWAQEMVDRQSQITACHYSGDYDRMTIELSQFRDKVVPKLHKAWRNDIDEANTDLINAESELRALKNTLYMREFDQFKSTIDLSAVFRAYAFHRMTFNGGQWKDFIEALFIKPTLEEIESFNEEIESVIP